MDTFSTIGLPGRGSGRTDAWNSLWATQMSRCGFMPVDKGHFDAELRIGVMGPLKLAHLSVDHCSVERSQSDIIKSGSRAYNFLLQAYGTSTFFHCGHQSRLGEGDFVLCNTAMPHYWEADGPSTTIMVRVEPEVLREYLPTPEQFCGLHLGRAIGFADTAGAMVRSLTGQVQSGGSTAQESQVAGYLLETISLSYMMAHADGSKGSAVVWQRHRDIVQHIEAHLRDPDLSPGSIASGLRLTPRYLRTIFSASGERISAYVLRRRLEECARQMRNPAWNGHTLTEIAFSWGFNSAAHFTRSFHDHYGVAPRAYRRLQEVSGDV
ncbi:helix-turn-helix domain-containing protein [Sphingomonas sp.]|uniref:helix-turn-helix domain-containing protein n=1 Tax=Sphingomonas sp. TaxID=28214 RepID=UPI000DB14EC3|nr:helix-turn-helix domain-containing protein [Sphingomonas sp.]PZU06125.1 MAG: hypothetical protein DI605_20135 [Sphingomonas sp.]